jgi:hypothetical protein
VRFKDFVTEAPKAAPAPGNDRVQLINDLLRETDSNYKMKLEPHMLDEAMTEAIHLMKRVHRGADDSAFTSNVALMAQAMKNTRKAILPFPTLDHSMQDAGMWIENEMVGKTVSAIQAHQLNIMNSTFFLMNLHELLLAISGLYRLYTGSAGHDGRIGTDEAERAFLKAGFKKLGIIE